MSFKERKIFMPISRDELKELIRDALSTPWLDGPSTFPSLSFHFVRNLSAIIWFVRNCPLNFRG